MAEDAGFEPLRGLLTHPLSNSPTPSAAGASSRLLSVNGIERWVPSSVVAGIDVVEVATGYGVSRIQVLIWSDRYPEGGNLSGLVDRPHRPRSHAWRLAAQGLAGSAASPGLKRTRNEPGQDKG